MQGKLSPSNLWTDRLIKALDIIQWISNSIRGDCGLATDRVVAKGYSLKADHWAVLTSGIACSFSHKQITSSQITSQITFTPMLKFNYQFNLSNELKTGKTISNTISIIQQHFNYRLWVKCFDYNLDREVIAEITEIAPVIDRWKVVSLSSSWWHQLGACE